MLSPKPYLNFFVPFLLILLSRLSFGVLLICFALLSMVYAWLSMDGFVEIFTPLLLLAVCHQYMRWDVSIVKYYFWRVLLWVLMCETIFYVKWHGWVQASFMDRIIYVCFSFLVILFWIILLELLHQTLEWGIQKMVKRFFPETEFSWINLRNLKTPNAQRNPFGLHKRW